MAAERRGISTLDRTWVAFFAVTATTLFVIAGICVAASDDPIPTILISAQLKDVGPAGKPTLLGASECKECHSNANPRASELYQETFGYDFVRLWENRVWGIYDLHSQAFENIRTDTITELTDKNRLAKQMQQIISATSGVKEYSVEKDERCLACHASRDAPNSHFFATKEGVGCEMCHGYGTIYKNIHRDSERIANPAKDGPTKYVPWRLWNPAEKTKYGLVNLRDPAVAVEKCASCHIGNLGEGRFVTHEMYAAGHPQLPPLDLMAFTREQPRHWGLPKEMPMIANLAKDDPKKAWDVFHYRSESEESYGTRRFAESIIATVKASATLLHQQAEKAKEDREGLDFAAFDCAACHHDLKYPSARQARGYDGPPGRPLFRPAPFVLARVVAGHAATMPNGGGAGGTNADLDKAVSQLALAFGTHTFGEPDKIAVAAASLHQWCDAAATKLAAVRYTPDQTRKLLIDLARAAEGPIADPEVSQLLAWGYETLRKEVGDDPKGLPDLEPQLANLVVTRLRPNLPPVEPKNPPDPDMAVKLKAEALVPVSARLRDRMTIFNNFRDDQFRNAFSNIERALSPK